MGPFLAHKVSEMSEKISLAMGVRCAASLDMGDDYCMYSCVQKWRE